MCGGAPGAPLFRRLVNRNNCVQKLRGTLIVTWQANRIDTALSAAPISPRGPCPSGPVVIIRFLSGGFDPRNIRARARAPFVVSRSRADSRDEKRMHGARNELSWPVNYAPSLPIGANNVCHGGLLIAGRIIRKRRCGRNSSVTVDTVLVHCAN